MKNTEKVHAYLRRNSPRTVQQIARACKLEPRQIRRCLPIRREDGLVVEDGCIPPEQGRGGSGFPLYRASTEAEIREFLARTAVPLWHSAVSALDYSCFSNMVSVL
jgi:predicted ArsR family transcriptional regulator